MKVHNLLVLKAVFSRDHKEIVDACRKCKVPFTKYNKNLYMVDLCTANHLNVQRLYLELGGVTPINLKLIKEGFGTSTKVFL